MGGLVKMSQEELQLKENKELDKKEIDQLHAAVLQFSNCCLEMKKLCSTVLAAIMGIILVTTETELVIAHFGAALMIIIIFWIVDSQAYYYQIKLRWKMTNIANEIRQNDMPQDFTMPLGDLEFSNDFLNHVTNVLKAAFNWSQTYYFLITFLILIAYYLFFNF